MGYIDIQVYNNTGKLQYREEYVGGGYKKYDANGNLIDYKPKVDDECIEENTEEPREFFNTLYPHELEKEREDRARYK